jgi:hypothetical protein
MKTKKSDTGVSADARCGGLTVAGYDAVRPFVGISLRRPLTS